MFEFLSKIMKVLVWLLLCLIWGTTWIFIKIGLEDLPPISFAYSRFLIAALILGFVIFLRKIPLPSSGKEWKILAITGILQFSINYSCVFWSEQYISSGLAAVLQAMISVFGLLSAWIHLPQERISAVKIISILMGIGGVAVIFQEQLQIDSIMGLAGAVAIVIGAAAAAEASVLTKAFGGGLHPATLVFWQMICGLPVMIIYGAAIEGNPFNFNWSVRAVFTVFYLAIAGTILTFWLYYWLLKQIESTRAMTISLVTPFVAVVTGAIVLGEKIPPQTMLGGILIIASIGLLVIVKSKKAAEIIK